MATEIKVPTLGESITSGIIAAWHVKEGDYVEKDQVIYELETDKITSEGLAEVSGVISLKAEEGDEVDIGQTVAKIEESASTPEKEDAPATSLSGGQQQMVAIGRALISNPKVLLCDEISLGLAPVVIKDIYAAFPKIKASGASVIVVEQDIAQALKVADRVYCMMEGRVTLSGKPNDLTREDIQDAYFGRITK